MQRRQRSKRRKMELFDEKTVLQFRINDRFNAIKVSVSGSPNLYLYKLLCFVSECTTYSLSLQCMRLDTQATWWNSFICEQHAPYLYEYATKTRIEPTEPTGIYSFVLMCSEYEIEAFDATSDEIRLMVFYLNPDIIDVSLKIWLSKVRKFV